MPKKIAILGSLASSLINFRFHLLKRLADRGYEVIACAPDASNEVILTLNEIGVKYQNIPICRTNTNPFIDIKNLWYLKNIFSEIKPDYILSYTMKPVIYGSIAARLSGVKNIYSMITGLGYVYTTKDIKARLIYLLMKPLLKISLSYNKAIFLQNPDDINELYNNRILRNYSKAILINGSGVDLEFYNKEPLPSNVSFLLIARLIKDKGIYEYVEAAKIVKMRYPDINFSIVGYIDSNPASISQDDLDNWIQDGMITFLGQLDDVRPALKKCSVYVLPSYREGTPRTVLEAMAVGRPIITTDAPGCRETVINGKNGYLIPIKDSIALANKMMHLINNPDLINKMAEASYEIVKDKYEVNKVNDIIFDRMELN